MTYMVGILSMHVAMYYPLKQLLDTKKTLATVLPVTSVYIFFLISLLSFNIISSDNLY